MMEKDLVALANAVESREKLIIDIISFVSDLLSKHGKLIEKNSHSAHTHTITKLDVRNLSFRGDFGRTMYGGNTITIWYDDKIVMDVYYQCDPKESEVKTFNEKSGDWIKILRHIKKNEKQIFAQIAKTKEKQQEEEDKTRLKKQQEKELIKKAKRLGLMT